MKVSYSLITLNIEKHKILEELREINRGLDNLIRRKNVSLLHRIICKLFKLKCGKPSYEASVGAIQGYIKQVHDINNAITVLERIGGKSIN